MEPNENSEIQTGMAVLENIDESFFKKEVNTKFCDKETKIEPSKDLENQVEI